MIRGMDTADPRRGLPHHDPDADARWRAVLRGDASIVAQLSRMRRIFRYLPSDRGAGAGRRPPALHVWLLAIRPATLPAAASGVIVGLGAALAEGVAFEPVRALLCLAVALLLQTAANLANDLSDYQRGADPSDRLGPLRVAAAGLVTARQLEVAIGVVLGAAALAGLTLAISGGPAVVVAGICAVLALLAYTGGPWPYGYHALGEPFVFLFFGLLAVAGTAFLQAGYVAPLFVAAALPVGALTTAVLVVNNLRDIETDRAAGKRTLAVMLGRTGTRVELAALVCLAYAVAFAMATVRGPALLLPLATLPLALAVLRQVRGRDPRQLNAVLAATARLDLAFAAAFAVGLALSR